MPETDSGSDTGKNKAVFVIEDSSDDNDFISDPEEPATKNVRSMNRPATKAGKSDPNGKMSQFLSAFEDSRSKQMLGKLNGKPDAAGSLKTPRKSVRGYSQEIDDDLADFIVDDDDDSDEVLVEDHNESALGSDSDGADQGADKRAHAFSPTFSRDKPQGALAMMPEEFSQCDLPTSFKTYVQYLVYWICNYRRRPLMNKKNAKYFFLAYVTVSRVIRSLEQSLVASSAWTEKFSNDLYSFPEYSSTKIPGCPGCDACHFHDKRTATFCIRLSGNPYKQDILAPPNPDGMGAESLADKSTFSDDSSDDVVSYPSDAHVDYNVGAVCKRRSETCHELHHYFFHLSNAVERDLGLLDYSSQSRASDLETDDGEIWDGFDPDDLVEMLEKQGRIDRLFADFKSLLSRSKIGFAKNT
ncbi:hypothetical protein LPJ75_005674 [Coemansia sp. RSA 2598]|nr:hypothetical protein LPJ75_005674 [Coemansia sp. RSA 2598]